MGKTPVPALLQKLSRFLQSWRGTPIQLSLSPPTIASDRPQEREAFPGSFFFFPFFIELKIGDVVHLGYLNQPIRNVMTKEIRWSSSLEWMTPSPSKPQVPWIDDPTLGVAHRQISGVEDVLGAEGTNRKPPLSI